MMDPFDKPYWSRLQVDLWVCTRSRDAVLAEYDPGTIRFADLSRDSHLLDDEEYDDELSGFANEEELIGTAIIRYGFVCPLEGDARREVVVARSDGRLDAHKDAAIGSPCAEFFERAAVLNLWREDSRARGSRAPAPGKVPQSGEARRLPSHSELVAFLLGYADGTKPEGTCRKAAGEHFRVTIPDSEKRWRPAWREVPKEKRLPRGQWSRRSRR